MKLRHILTAVATAAAVLAVAAPAQAAPATGTTAAATTVHKSWIWAAGAVSIDPHNPRVGYVPATYRCYGTGAIWVSVKQVASLQRDERLKQEGSSQISSAWSDSHRNSVTCDGKKHYQVFTVDQTEPYFTENGPTGQKSDIYQPLRRGWAYVQLCLFDDNNTEEPVSHMPFRPVVGR
jgi:hypothetical protein